MYQDRILLTTQDILEKEFKIDTRGYRPQEVDKFLDMIIRDYEEMLAIIKELNADKKEILDENLRLKQDIRNLKMKLDVVGDNTGNSGITNVDILKRLSNLEKIIYGKDE